ncbi:MAG: dihydroneopterin aldolase [Stenotrophobium sp.]
MDKVFIRGLEASTIIGIRESEKRAARPLLLDLEMGVDTRPAAASDKVRDAIDYQVVRDAVVAFVTRERVDLLETLAERLSRHLFAEFTIDSLRLRITKPGAVAGVKAVGVEIERLRGDYAVCGR